MHKAFKSFTRRAAQDERIEMFINELIRTCDLDNRPEAAVFSDILRAARRKLFVADEKPCEHWKAARKRPYEGQVLSWTVQHCPNCNVDVSSEVVAVSDGDIVGTTKPVQCPFCNVRL